MSGGREYQRGDIAQILHGNHGREVVGSWGRWEKVVEAHVGDCRRSVLGAAELATTGGTWGKVWTKGQDKTKKGSLGNLILTSNKQTNKQITALSSPATPPRLYHPD